MAPQRNNSAIVHSGIDCKTGTLMAQMNIRGNGMMDELSKQLDFEFRRNGSLIVCFSEDDIQGLRSFTIRESQMACRDLKFLIQRKHMRWSRIYLMRVVAAIYCPTGGIVCPFGMNIAFAENAAANGVRVFLFNTEVKEIQKEQTGYIPHYSKWRNSCTLRCKCSWCIC